MKKGTVFCTTKASVILPYRTASPLPQASLSLALSLWHHLILSRSLSLSLSFSSLNFLSLSLLSFPFPFFLLSFISHLPLSVYIYLSPLSLFHSHCSTCFLSSLLLLLALLLIHLLTLFLQWVLVPLGPCLPFCMQTSFSILQFPPLFDPGLSCGRLSWRLHPVHLPADLQLSRCHPSLFRSSNPSPSSIALPTNLYLTYTTTVISYNSPCLL